MGIITHSHNSYSKLLIYVLGFGFRDILEEVAALAKRPQLLWYWVQEVPRG